MSKQEKIKNFNPNGVGVTTGGIFGLPFEPSEAEIVIIPVPWDVTTSYRGGTSRGPEAILKASPQLDLFVEGYIGAWKVGYAMEEIPAFLLELNDKTRSKAKKVIDFLESGGKIESDAKMAALVKEVNEACGTMVEWVKSRSREWIAKGKQVAVLGGDHSSPLGLLQALAEKHDNFSILQFDAHADLRDAYEGFTYSHASIMFNALQLSQIGKLVQVGLREYSEGEAGWILNSLGKIKEFTNRLLNRELFEGKSWKSICEEIAQELPQKVYVSFDIDGLEPSLCPNTGTPVPGGLRFEQALYLLETVVASGKQIIGFDLCEVAPGPDKQDDWDGNVGAKLLWRLCNLSAQSNKILV